MWYSTRVLAQIPGTGTTKAWWPSALCHHWASGRDPLWHWPRRSHMPPITEQVRHFPHAPEKVLLLKCLRARVSGQLKFLVIWRTTSLTFAFLTFWKYFLISACILLLRCTAESAWGLCVCESSSCSQLRRCILLSKINWCRHRRRGTGRSHHWPLVPKSEADFSYRSQYQLFQKIEV